MWLTEFDGQTGVSTAYDCLFAGADVEGGEVEAVEAGIAFDDFGLQDKRFGIIESSINATEDGCCCCCCKDSLSRDHVFVFGSCFRCFSFFEIERECFLETAN